MIRMYLFYTHKSKQIHIFTATSDEYAVENAKNNGAIALFTPRRVFSSTYIVCTEGASYCRDNMKDDWKEIPLS